MALPRAAARQKSLPVPSILDVSSGQSVYQRSWSDLQPADFDKAFAPWLAIVRGHRT